MSALKTNQPTYMRFARVQHVLSQELAFKDRLSDKTEAILKPDGTPQLFSREVIQVTQQIHDSGEDAHKCKKIDVIRVAAQVFGILGGKPPAPPVAPAVAPEPPPAPVVETPKPVAQEAKNGAPKKPVKAVAAPKPKPAPAAPKQKPKPAAAKPKPVETKAQETPPPTQESTPKVEIPKLKENGVSTKYGANGNPYDTSGNPYISMYSLTLSTIQLCDTFDNQPGGKDRLKRLEELLSEFQKYASASKSAKEVQKA